MLARTSVVTDHLPIHPRFSFQAISGEIDVLVHVVLVTRQVLRLDQHRDPLLDHRHLRYKVVLDRLNRRRLQLLVHQLLPSFHYTHDRGIQGVLAVLLDRGLRPLGLLGLWRG